MLASLESPIGLNEAFVVERRASTLRIRLSANALDLPNLAQDDGTWLRQVAINRLEICCEALDAGNSVLIGWIVRLCQAAPSVRIILAGLSDRVRFLIRRMRLERMVELA